MTLGTLPFYDSKKWKRGNAPLSVPIVVVAFDQGVTAKIHVNGKPTLIK